MAYDPEQWEREERERDTRGLLSASLTGLVLGPVALLILLLTGWGSIVVSAMATFGGLIGMTVWLLRVRGRGPRR